jgi:hypothetical protein
MKTTTHTTNAVTAENTIRGVIKLLACNQHRDDRPASPPLVKPKISTDSVPGIIGGVFHKAQRGFTRTRGGAGHYGDEDEENREQGPSNRSTAAFVERGERMHE